MLLTIGIPVYNGSAAIAETLDSIVIQDCSEFEVLIMDNASTDNTLEIVQKYEEKYDFIRHIKNETNIGYDQNYNLAICNANGRFVWTLCDDDIIKPKGIEKIIGILKEHGNILCNIFVNYSIYNGDITICKEERATKIYSDVICDTPDSFYEISTNGTVVASSNIISKQLWMNTDKVDMLSSDSKWIQVDGVTKMRITHKEYKSYCIADPILILRQGEVKWIANGGLYLLTLNLLSIFKQLKKIGYTHKTTQIMINTIYKPMWGIIITSKVNGLVINYPLLKKSWLLMDGFSYMRILNMVLLLIPNILHALAYNILKTIKYAVMK